MARLLASQTGVQAPDADYPKGRVVDNQTLWQETVVGDFVQFFQKLISEAGITENGNPDNESNGYQLVEALQEYIKAENLIVDDAWKEVGNDGGETLLIEGAEPCIWKYR